MSYLDHHVHLGLIDPHALVASGVTTVVDLGWTPAIADIVVPGLEVLFAGQFLAAPEGYPSQTVWAPHGSVAYVDGPSGAPDVVAAQLALGASLIKVTLNRDAGPVLDLATLSAIVTASPLPVVAHAQGAGMVELAIAAGITALAHTPWTHHLDDAVVEEAVELGQCWISTLDIHGYGAATPDQAVALDNLARFHRAGGRVLYGTDLGNGPLPATLNQRELGLLEQAGLSADSIDEALTDPWPRRL